MNGVTETSRKYSFDLSEKKAKYMAISKNSVTDGQLLINRQIENFNKYTNRGTQLNDKLDYSQDTRCRIKKARAEFIKMVSVLKILTTEEKLLHCYIFSVLLYGVSGSRGGFTIEF